MRPIGGFMALERPAPLPRGSAWEGWPGEAAGRVVRGSARGALEAWLRAAPCRRLWLPALGCAVLREAAAAAGVSVIPYALDEDLAPSLGAGDATPQEGDAVLVIDLMGKPPSPAHRRRFRTTRGVVWIEDRAQALDPGLSGPFGGWAPMQLFSPRKLLGVPDGGLLVHATEASPVFEAQVEVMDGMFEPFGWRGEELTPGDQASVYAAYQRAEAARGGAHRGMTGFSQAWLKATPLRPLVFARIANYAALWSGLAGLRHPGFPPGAWAPLAFPVLVEDRARLVARLAERKIFAAVHWPEVVDAGALGPNDRRWAEHALSLPCDPRLRPEDLKRLMDSVGELAA